jgi:hypothetical protein
VNVPKRVAIVQSNYIPWKGYFDLIASVDEFILYDDVQFTKNDWRNRNKIKTPKGAEWLSIPVGPGIDRRIRDVELPNNPWQQRHWRAFEANYRRAAHYGEIAPILAPHYLEPTCRTLSAFNRSLIETVCKYLGIGTKLSNSSDYVLSEGKSERVADLCLQAGASEYISGPAAQDYIDERVFADRGVTLSWFDYSGYPEYPQLWGAFSHHVSILDLMFNCGKDAPRYMKHAHV